MGKVIVFLSIVCPLRSDISNRSVHNVRIERLWVDVTAQIGAHWHEAFIQLELHHGMDINNGWHLWLLHRLFLSALNDHLAFFADAWNQHRIQIRNGPNRSPADMFQFDMLVHGLRGTLLPQQDESMTDEELEVFGVDWEGLQEDRLLESLRRNTSRDEPGSSWIGRTGPPENLNEVVVEPPPEPSADSLLNTFDATISQIKAFNPAITVSELWTLALVEARRLFGSDLF